MNFKLLKNILCPVPHSNRFAFGYTLCACLICGLLWLGGGSRMAMAAEPQKAQSATQLPPASQSQQGKTDAQTQEMEENPNGKESINLSQQNGKTVYRLEGVQVVDRRDQPGQTVLDGERLRLNPSNTGTVNDALRGQSNVQFDLNSRSGLSGGEITPPKISVGGAKHYENNFTINGVPNNNAFSPSGFDATQGDGANVPPSGDSQGMFLDTSLFESVTLHSSNVSAEYGEFLGGVVESKLRNARMDSWHGSAKYRHTRDSWAKQYYHPDWEPADPENPDISFSAGHQPRFRRHEFFSSIEGPIAEKLGIVLSYGIKRSTIPLYQNTINREVQNQYRENENIMMRINTHNIENFKASITAIVAPYESTTFTSGRLNSNRQVQGGGYAFIMDATNTFSFGSLTNTLSVKEDEVSRYGDTASSFSWRKTNGSANWGTGTSATATSQAGGMGDYLQESTAYGFKSLLDLKPIGPIWFRNTIKSGGELYHTDYKRSYSGASVYNWTNWGSSPGGPVNSGAVGEQENGVIAGEQWLNRRVVYPESSLKLSVLQAAGFMEDTITVERFTIRPGVRVSYDDLSKNTDIAPRLFVNADVFNDGMLNVYGGINRYYGSQLISHALYNPAGFIEERRTRWDQPWQYYSKSAASTWQKRRVGNLETPYSDEKNLGARLNIFDTVFKVEGLLRDHKKQIRSRTVPDSESTEYSREFANSGKTEHWGITFGIEKSLDLDWAGRHVFDLSATRSSTKSNSTSLDAGFDEVDSDGTLISNDYVYYRGAIIPTEQLPANNFNSPWVLALNHTVHLLEERLRLASLLRYEEGGKGMAQNGYIDKDGLRYRNYTKKNYKDAFTYDLAIEYDVLKHKQHTLSLRLEVLNLFDNKNISDTSTSSNDTPAYSMGRQFWAGVTYEF